MKNKLMSLSLALLMIFPVSSSIYADYTENIS